mmetsp:Transcript_1089/g.2920  ORF Transcript_1089/g.2920 Transcript_1089/m.2920 type:complete len:772 (+) Transcript_1089:648-2963(+)
MVRRGRYRVVGLPMRGFDGGGQVVVHQRVAQQVALCVEGHLLAHGHRESFGQAAVDLALDDHRVDAGAAVVQRVEAADLGLAGAPVDVDHAQVDAEGEGEVGRVVVVNGLQARLQSGRRLVVRGPCDVLHGLELRVVALDLEAVDLPVQIVLTDLEQVRSDLARLGVDLARGQRDRGTGHRRGTRAIGTQAIRRSGRVSFFHLDHLGRDAQFGGDDLRVGGLVTLALRDRAHAGDRAASRVDADFAGVEHAHAQDVAHLAGPCAHHFGERDQADAHQRRALGVGTLGGLLSTQALVVHRVQHLLQRRVVVARVVFEAEGTGVRELLLADEVLGADLGLVHAELLRQHVDHALDQVHRLRHAERAAVGNAARRLVGVDPLDAAEGRRDVVRTRADVEHARGELGGVGAGIEGAVVREDMHAQAQDLAVRRGGEFAVHVVVAGERRRGDVLDPVLDPLDRLAQHDGRDDGADITRVDADLVAEAAADVGADDAHLGFRDARQQRDHRAHHVRRLRGDVGCQLAADRIEAGHAATGFQRAGMHARVDDPLAHRDGRVREGGIDRRLVAGLPGEDVVVVIALAVSAFGLARQVFAQHRRAGIEGLVWIDHDRQFLVLDLHRLDGIRGDVAVVGDHDRHFLHLEVHLLVGQHRGHVTGQRGHPVQLERLEVVGSQHRVHAGDGERGRLVDALDAAVRDRRTHDVHVQHAGHLDVVDIVALALNEAGVLLAQTALAHALQGGAALEQLRVSRCVHAASFWVSRSLTAAYSTALTMFW